MNDEHTNEEREPGQHPHVHEPAEVEPERHDSNEHADARTTVLQPDGERAPTADDVDQAGHRDE